jgi:hypothetical protein
MSKPVPIREIVDALEMQFDEQPAYLDRDSGEVHVVQSDLLRNAEEGEEPSSLPEWQKPIWEIAKEVVATDRFVPLPSKFDVDEWAIMEEFSLSVEQESVRDELLRAIHGKGAFRYFKDVIHRLGIQSAWYEFRTNALREIAIEWCQENAISWSE